MTTEPERKRRAHDLAKIKARLKYIAEDTRAIRDEARTLSGMDRWHKQREADENALTARSMGLAYGYLRGMSISRMESPYSDPDEVPDAGYILMFAHAAFEQGPEGLGLETPPEPSTWEKLMSLGKRWWGGDRSVPAKARPELVGWEDFEDRVRDDLSAWRGQLAANRAARAAERRVA